MKKENLRHHKEPLKIIREIEKPRWGILTHRYAPFNNVKARFKLSAKSFNLAFQYSIFRKKRRLDLGASYKKVQFSLSSRTLILEDFFLNRHSPPKFNGQVGFFYTKGFSKTKKYYYRLIIPLEREIKFHYILEEHFFTTDLGYGCRTGTKATFADDDLLVSILQDKEQKKHFLSIESPKAQQFEIFSQKTFAVKIALGYLTGSFAGGSGYYFAYSNKKLEHVKHFYHCSFRDTIESSYTPVYTNPFGRLHHRKQVAKSYYK